MCPNTPSNSCCLLERRKQSVDLAPTLLKNIVKSENYAKKKNRISTLKQAEFTQKDRLRIKNTLNPSHYMHPYTLPNPSCLGAEGAPWAEGPGGGAGLVSPELPL